MFDSYCEDYHYVCSTKINDACKIQIHIYSFTLPKKKKRYIVEVEEYIGFVFILKFYVHNHRLSKNRFNIMTGDNQVSKVVMTVFLILFEILTTHSTASFAFMGAPIKTKSFTEAATETKRLSFYKKFLHNRLGEKTFEFLQGVENSVYVLKNRTNLDMDNQMQVIGAYLYDNFEDLEIELSPVSFSSQSG